MPVFRSDNAIEPQVARCLSERTKAAAAAVMGQQDVREVSDLAKTIMLAKLMVPRLTLKDPTCPGPPG